MASPSPPPSAAAASADSPPRPPPSRRGLPPPCWSHDETLALIESYRDKWNALRRGNLRAADWDEVAGEVTRRCSRLPASTPKTSVQCRHKVEKLRKRFRSERLRSLSIRPSSSWPFFSLMESLDRPPNPHSDSPSDSDSAGNVRRLQPIMPNGNEALRFTIPKAVRSKIVTPCSGSRRSAKLKPGFELAEAKPSMEELRRRLERKKKEEREREGDVVGEMVSALRTVGDGFIRMERMKMDMARETERMRMEMELKRTEMILDSQSRVIDAFVKGFVGSSMKKAKISPEN